MNKCWVFNESSLSEALDEYEKELKTLEHSVEVIQNNVNAINSFLNSFILTKRKMVMQPLSELKTKSTES